MSTHEPTMTGTKVCTKCKRELPVICFSVVSSNKDGLRNQCRECVIAATRKSYTKKKKDIPVNIREHQFHNDLD